MKRIVLLIPLITILSSCSNNGAAEWHAISSDEALNVVSNIANNWHMPSRVTVRNKDNIVYVNQVSSDAPAKKYKLASPCLAYNIDEHYAKGVNCNEDGAHEEYYIISPNQNNKYNLWDLNTQSDLPDENEEISFMPGNKTMMLEASKETMVSAFRVNLYGAVSNLELYPLVTFNQIITECDVAHGTSTFESKDNKSLKAHAIYTIGDYNTYEYYGLYENCLPKEILVKITSANNGDIYSYINYVFDHESKVVQDKINLEEWEETHD